MTFTVTEQFACHYDFGIFARREKTTIGIIERERNLGIRERAALFRAFEYYVLHIVATQKLGGLLAENPTHSVRNVALAATVRTYDSRYAFGKADRRLYSKGFESVDG